MSKTNGWTPARRQAQAKRIHEWKPWQQSTGPRTSAGKQVSSRNADQGAIRCEMRALARVMRTQRTVIQTLA